MASLAVTLIDVGWGDSILVEWRPDQGPSRFGLVDCNDYEKERSSFIFVKRFFDRRELDFEHSKPNFEWVLLTHGHADHARGMKRMLSAFGTRWLWYPKSVASTTYGTLLRYANLSSSVERHQSVDETKILAAPEVDFGDVSMQVLWPNHDQIDTGNENNNSVVLALTLGTVTFVLSGDAEAPSWPAIVPRLPATTGVLQAPHHGAENGMFDGTATPWLDALPADAWVVMSSHIRPHHHPHPRVVSELEQRGVTHYRTDRHYHVTFSTDGNTRSVEYWH